MAVVLLAVSVGWTTPWDHAAEADPGPILALAALGAAIIGVSALATRQSPRLLPAVLAVSTLALVVFADSALGDGPLGGPLGYANADAALYVQAAAACLMIAVMSPGGPVRTTAVIGSVLAVAMCVVARSHAAFLGGLLLLGGTALAAALPSARRVLRLLACGVVVAAALLAPAIAATEAEPPGFDQRRLALWSDALALVEEEPFDGVGARRFPELSPTAQADADTRETHAEVLQVAAEGGVPAALLLTAAAVSLAVAFLVRRGAGLVPVVAALAWAALWLHAGVDYVLHFPTVIVAAGVVAGAGLTAQPARRGGPGNPR